MDPILRIYEPYISEFGYSTQSIGTTSPSNDYLVFADLIEDWRSLGTYGMSPSTLIDTSIVPKYQNTTAGIGLTEQLYTASGSQSHATILDVQKNTYSFDPATDLTFFVLTDYFTSTADVLMDMGWKQSTAFTYSHCGTQDDYEGLFLSIPMFATFRDASIDNIELKRIVIKFNDKITQELLTQFKIDCADATPAPLYYVNSLTFESSGSDNQDIPITEKITKIMNKGFDSIIVMTMFLCFFALSANMSSNLYQQTKEIAVLRSIGFTKWRIRWLYFYEAMILVLASCSMGIMVGMVVGYTMSL